MLGCGSENESDQVSAPQIWFAVIATEAYANDPDFESEIDRIRALLAEDQFGRDVFVSSAGCFGNVPDSLQLDIDDQVLAVVSESKNDAAVILGSLGITAEPSLVADLCLD